MKKDNYFGCAQIIAYELGKSLVIPDVFGNSELSVCDGEMRDRNDSEPVAVFTITEDEKEKIFLIQKVDCLALATFLLNIHNDFVTKQNETKLQEYRDMLNLNNKISTSSESNT